MSINSKLYKINKVNILPSRKYLNGPKSPTHHSVEAPLAKCPKGSPTDKRAQRKRPAYNSPKSAPHHRKTHVRKAGDQGKSKIHPRLHYQQTLTKENFPGDDSSRKSQVPSSPHLSTHKRPHSRKKDQTP